MGVLDGLRARLDRLLAEHTRADPRAVAAGLREAVIEARAAVAGMRDQLERSRRELDLERKAGDDAERRGRLAREIDDQETAQLADIYVGKHTGRVELLERKIAVQVDELQLAQRELEQMTSDFRAAQAGGAQMREVQERAWRDIEAAGGTRPDLDLQGELLKAQADRKLHEAAVEAQLAHLKKQLGKDRG